MPQGESTGKNKVGERPYRLSIDGALEDFRPELEFACQFLDQCHHVSHQTDADLVLHYGDNPPEGATHIPSALFPDGVKVNSEGIHPVFDTLDRLAAGSGPQALLPPDDHGDAPPDGVGYDALGLIFLMLSRLEERGSPATFQDLYGRYPAEASVLSRWSGLATPIADIAAIDIARALTGQQAPPSRSTYKVWLTHDVDGIRGYFTLKHLFKNAAGDVIFRHNPKSAITSLWRAGTSGEPWRAFRYVMDLAEGHGHTCHFNFMGPTENLMDNPYVLRSPDLVRRLAKEITGRGHVVGFHPGADSRRDVVEWRRQRTGLEAVIGQAVVEGRHHGLLFDADFTWDMWDDEGMEREMSLGYPAPSGFRSGTCRSHPIYSLRHRRSLKLTAVPTAIMDFGFFGGRYRDISVDEAIAESQVIVDVCRKHGGDLVVLFHPSDMRPPRTTFFEQMLEII
jgi:hypothetical protein